MLSGGCRSVPEQFLELGRRDQFNDRRASVSHLKTMHRTSAKKLVREVRLNGRATRRKIRLSLKKPRVAHLETLKPSLPERPALVKKAPANGANGHHKAEPVLHDQQARTVAHDAFRLGEHHLDKARVLVDLGGERDRLF